MPPIDKSFEVHDQFQFEMKLDYWLSRDRRADYQVDMYLFLPNSLDVNPGSYPRSSFYGDIKNYVRLKTPEVDLGLVPSLAEGQPGGRLRKSIDQWLQDPHDKAYGRVAEYHAMMYTSITARALWNGLAEITANPDATHLREFVDETEAALALLRTLSAQVTRASGPAPGDDHRLPTILSSADEYLTAEAGQILLRFLAAMKNGPPEPELDLAVVIDSIRSLQDHAQAMNHATMVGDDEDLIFRHSVHKKFFRSHLFLKQRSKAEGQVVNQVSMGIAAGLSMVFATLIAFLAQQRFGNFTLPLFVALVVGYVFKDRIKDLTRLYLEKWLSRRIFDSKTHFFDKEERRMGSCREMVRYVGKGQVPEDVQALRHVGHVTEIANFWQLEQVIHYRKKISLFRKPLQRINPGYHTKAVNDIIRINIKRLLWNMDEPAKEILTLGDDDTVKSVTGARIYKINLVVQLESRTGKKSLRFRLVLDRNGIRRMQEVSPLHPDN